MKHLNLIRHGKAVDATGFEEDHERPLRDRGRRASAELGQLLAAPPPDLILCSTALRTRQTVACAIAAWPLVPAIRYEGELYLSSAARLRYCLEQIEPDIDRVWLVGHNPGIHELARLLAGGTAGAVRWPELMQHFPTAARAAFAIDADRWSGLGQARRELVAFGVPSPE